jgi:5-methylcytosine-specific restriction endonuclease McrA
MSWNPFRDAKTRAAWRDELMHRQNGLCAICGYRFPEPGELNEQLQLAYSPTFDHVIPRSQGGADDVGNFRLVHGACNLARGEGNGSKPTSIPRVLRSPAPEQDVSGGTSHSR